MTAMNTSFTAVIVLLRQSGQPHTADTLKHADLENLQLTKSHPIKTPLQCCM